MRRMKRFATSIRPFGLTKTAAAKNPKLLEHMNHEVVRFHRPGAAKEVGAPGMFSFSGANRFVDQANGVICHVFRYHGGTGVQASQTVKTRVAAQIAGLSERNKNVFEHQFRTIREKQYLLVFEDGYRPD